MVITEIQHLPTVHKNLITSLIITTPDTAVNLSVSRVWCRLCQNKSLNEWPGETCFKKQILRVTLLFGISKGWIHQPCRSCKPSTSPSCQQLEKSMQLGDQWKTLRFHTHANYAHLCWKATALARRPSDSIVFWVFFFLANISHCIPSLVLWGLPLQIPPCVYTAAVQYGLVLICSI